jgi:hypothetical protein
MPVTQDGGALRGGAPRAVWFSSESDPRVVSARSMAADLRRRETPPHLVWNPCSGQIVQLVPVTRAAALLDVPARSEGRICVQVLVIGHSRDPFTGTLLDGLNSIVQWLDSWRVERRWPAGPPLPSPQSYHSSRARRDWARGGYFGASQVPGVHRPDPGGIDIRRITGPETPVTALPWRRHMPGRQPSRHAASGQPSRPAAVSGTVPLRPAPAPAPVAPAQGNGASSAVAVPLPRGAESPPPTLNRVPSGTPAASAASASPAPAASAASAASASPAAPGPPASPVPAGPSRPAEMSRSADTARPAESPSSSATDGRARSVPEPASMRT